MLGAWGRAVHRLRWWLVGLALIPLSLWLWVTPGVRLDESVVPPEMEAVRAVQLLDDELAPRPPSFGLIFSSPTLRSSDAAFHQAMLDALKPLQGDARLKRVRTPYDEEMPEPERKRLLSRDGHSAIAMVELKGRAPAFASMVVPSAPPDVFPALRGLVRSSTLEIVAFGPMALNHDFVTMVKDDLKRAEWLVLPLVLLFLIVVFGSVVAAALPLAVGLLGVSAGNAMTSIIAHLVPVSAYAANVVSMIGLGVAIDYSLFVVSRYREEMGRHAPPQALARTLETAGRTVVFSALTVAIGLLGMVLLRMGSVSTIGIASTIVVAFAVLYSLTLLPALLAILGPRVNALPVRLGRQRQRRERSNTWERVATFVMARPWHVLIPVTLVLLVLGLPFRHIHLGTPDPSTLPRSAESRRGQALLAREFPHVEPNAMVVVLRYADAGGLTPARVDELFTMSRWLARQQGVDGVESLVDLDRTVGIEEYRMMATAPREMLPAQVRMAFERLAGPHVAVLVAQTSYRETDPRARALVQTIRREHPPVRADVLVTGRVAYDLDFIELVKKVTPGAVAFIVVATMVALFVLLGSILLPIKAVIMNGLSVTASYGALVWIFQDGHLKNVLDFTPAPIELRHPLYLHDDRVAGSPYEGRLRLSGTMELTGLDTGISRRRVDAIARAAGRYLRGWPADARPAKVASGLRPLTPDGLPVLGRVPNALGVWVASGHSMLGVTLGPASGEALAEAIGGADPDVLRPFNPSRFG